MASSIEIRAAQKSELFRLLKLKRLNEKAGIKVEGINELITELKVPMEAEDVAYVEKLIAELG